MGVFQDVAGAADGEPFLVEQAADATDQKNLMVLIVAPVATSLDWSELGKFLFPVAQHMRLDRTKLAHFTYSEVAFRRNRRKNDVSLDEFRHSVFPPGSSVFGSREK